MSLARKIILHAASPCARLSRAPSTISVSDFPCGVRRDFGCASDVGVLGKHDCRDRKGPPRFLDASISERAVQLYPAGLSGDLAIVGHLPVAFREIRVRRRPVVANNEACATLLSLRPVRRSVYASLMSLPP